MYEGSALRVLLLISIMSSACLETDVVRLLLLRGSYLRLHGA